MFENVEKSALNGQFKYIPSLTPANFAGLRIARYQVRLRAEGETALPSFLGSTLRGAFGYALKQAVCVMNHRDCGRCLVANQCVYPYVFETPAPPNLSILHNQRNAPHPFIIDPPIYPRRNQADRQRILTAGDELEFGLTIMGRAIGYLPYIVYALHEMAQRGIGKGRAQFALAGVSVHQSTGIRHEIFDDVTQRLDETPDVVSDLSPLIDDRLDQLQARGSDDRLNIRFITPLRIKVQGDLQPKADFEMLVRNLLRRISLLMIIHGDRQLDLDFKGLLELARAVEVRSSSLHWWDWGRYSARQETVMKLGGFVGEAEFTGDRLQDFLPLIVAGEFLRIGSATSFGLGKYELIDVRC
ncbi:MAG: CRISPR system precrRNA processing endoribonuclease RAMP protein Cas6 [Acidobacteria bacterium]|nr:CRISPR system precrRNA processing endoribonuclease RAMP protein Cas6 [Acidobacteriota bacterium]